MALLFGDMVLKFVAMNKLIETKLDVINLARKNAEIVGEYPLSNVAKITGKIMQDSAPVRIKLNFDKVDYGFNVVNIEWQTTATAECEACSKPLKMPLSAKNSLAVCKNLKQADALPDAYEPLMLDDEGMLSLEQLLVEEIMLMLPIIPRHEDESCSTKYGVSNNADTEQTHKPFASLGQNILELGDK